MKKQIFKRLLSAILSTVMMLVMMPTIALPTFAETYNGTCGENLTWSLDTGTGTLTISGTGEMSDYNVGYDAPWEDFFHSMDMLTVIIEEGVTSIGKNAFSLTHIIKSVVIPEGVTSIGEGAFADSGVKSIVIPASVINVGEDAFAICNIETIYYGGNKTSWDKIKDRFPQDEVGAVIFPECVGEHPWDDGVVIANPTHFTEGEKSFVCTECNATKNEEIEKLETHVFTSWSKYDDIQHTRSCECGEVEYAEHIWSNGTITTEPTHIKTGEITFTCTAFNCNATRTEPIDKISTHTFGSWTKYNADQHVRTCSCGEKEYANHDWDEGVVTATPTHISEGTKLYYCTACGQSKTESVPRIETHSFNDWSKYSDTQHFRFCACYKIEYEEHDFGDGVITTEPTYTTEGVKTFTCVCGETKTEVLPCLVMPENALRFVIDSTDALVGNNFTVTARIENNPGIWSAAFELFIDTEVFEFVSADTSDSIFDQFAVCDYDETDSTYKFNGYNSSFVTNIKGDGTAVTLTLKVKEGVAEGEYALALELLAKNIINVDQQKIESIAIDGKVNVLDYILGDANGDGDISNADVLVIFRYIYNAELYPIPQLEAADVNCDGDISNADVLCIFRYIYNPTLYPLE